MKIYRFFTGLAIFALSISACANASTTAPILASTPTIAPSSSPANPDPTNPPAVQSEPTSPATSTPQPTASPVACASPAPLTPSATEGPYFTADSPERASLIEPGMPGTILTLTGHVLTADCQPVANALLDFWQADSQGVYDNSGYILRGHQFTDANGRFQLETVVPGLYPGRTEHIHVKVQAPGGPVLTTQLFFPDVTDNAADRIYDPALLILIQDSASNLQGTFNFIVETQ